MNQDLLEIFKNANYWLRHAESKNAMLVAFNGAAIFGLIRILNIQIVLESSFLTYYILSAVGLLVISLLITFISFIPRLKMIPAGIGTGKLNKINCFYFENLKELNKEEIYQVVIGTILDENTKRIDLDLAEQIRQISIITSRKFSHFTIAVWITGGVFILTLLTTVLAGIIQIICN